MSKVKVSKEVAEVLEEYTGNGWTFKNLMLRKLEKGGFHSALRGRCFNDISHEDFASILLNGYEVVETPQERWSELVKTYEALKESGDVREILFAAERLIVIRQMNKDFNLNIPGAD